MNAPGPPPYNPYGAPAAPPADWAASASIAPGLGLKWVYLALSALLLVCEVLVVTSPWVSPLQAGVAGLSTVATCVVWARTFVAVAWVTMAWRGIPERWRPIAPGRAALLFFVPLYGFYWAFVVGLRLCAALDAVLVAAGDPRRAPRQLAIAAPSVGVAMAAMNVPLSLVLPAFAVVVTIATTFAWFAYVFVCDRARCAVVEVAPRIPEGRSRRRR